MKNIQYTPFGISVQFVLAGVSLYFWQKNVFASLFFIFTVLSLLSLAVAIMEAIEKHDN